MHSTYSCMYRSWVCVYDNFGISKITLKPFVVACVVVFANTVRNFPEKSGAVQNHVSSYLCGFCFRSVQWGSRGRRGGLRVIIKTPAPYRHVWACYKFTNNVFIEFLYVRASLRSHFYLELFCTQRRFIIVFARTLSRKANDVEIIVFKKN